MPNKTRQFIQTLVVFARAHRRLFVFVGAFAIVVTLGWVGHVWAQADTAGTATGVAPTSDTTLEDAKNWITQGVAQMAIWLTGWVLRLIMFFLQFLIQVASYNDYLGSPAVEIGWVLVRDMANMFFVIILLVIAFGTILGIEQYEYKKMIGKFVMAAILVNFSHLICGLIIDVAQVFTITFVNGIAAAAGGNVINAFKLDGVMSFAKATSYKYITGTEVFIAAIAGLVFSILALATMVGYTAILVARMVVLWVLIVLSPLAFALGVLPQSQKYAGQWWSQFTTNVIVAPICVFFLWLCFATIGEGDINSKVAANNPGAMDITQVNTEGDALPSAGITDVMQWGNLGSFVIALAMLLAGIKVTLEIGAVGSSALQKSVDFAKTGMKKTLKWGAMNAPLVGGKSWINRGLALYTGVQGAKVVYNDMMGKVPAKIAGALPGGAAWIAGKVAGKVTGDSTTAARWQKGVSGAVGVPTNWIARQLKFGAAEMHEKEYKAQLEEQKKSIEKSVGMSTSAAGERTAMLKAKAEIRVKGADAQRTLNDVEAMQQIRLGEEGHGWHARHEATTEKEARAQFAKEGLHFAEENDMLVVKTAMSDEELKKQQAEEARLEDRLAAERAKKRLEKLKDSIGTEKVAVTSIDAEGKVATDNEGKPTTENVTYGAVTKDIQSTQQRIENNKRLREKTKDAEELNDLTSAINTDQNLLRNLRHQEAQILTHAEEAARGQFSTRLEVGEVDESAQYISARNSITKTTADIETLNELKRIEEKLKELRVEPEKNKNIISTMEQSRDKAISDLGTRFPELDELWKGNKFDSEAVAKAIDAAQGQLTRATLQRNAIEGKYGLNLEGNQGAYENETKVLELLKKLADAREKGDGKAQDSIQKEINVLMPGSSYSQKAADIVNAKSLKEIKTKSAAIVKELKTMNSQRQKSSEAGQREKLYESSLRHAPALSYADAWAKRDHSARFQRAGIEDLRHRASQKRIWEKKGLSMPSTAYVDAAEGLGKEMNDMNYEQLLSNLTNFSEAMLKKRENGEEISLEDNLVSIAIFRKLFQNGWIDDANTQFFKPAKDQSQNQQFVQARDVLKQTMGSQKFGSMEQSAKMNVNVNVARLNTEQENSLEDILNAAGVSKELLTKIQNNQSGADIEMQRLLNTLKNRGGQFSLQMQRLGIKDANEVTEKIIKRLNTADFKRMADRRGAK
ncbi:MAG: hypothetical protein WCT40_00775 [Candidatus Magasanikbacteria bacterium]